MPAQLGDATLMRRIQPTSSVSGVRGDGARKRRAAVEESGASEQTNRELRTQIGELEESIDGLHRELEAHRSTLSWRITAPLRALRSRWRTRPSRAAVERVAPATAPPAPSSAPSSVLSTFAHNRAAWDEYATAWDDPAFRSAVIDDPDAVRPADLEVLGDEWGRPEEVGEIIDSWIRPYVAPGGVVGEIGPGGGRIARQVAPAAGEFWCFDVSSRMLARVRQVLADVAGVQYVLLEEPGLPAGLDARFDFIYAFDVLVHFDLYQLWRYVRDIDRLLRPGGRALLHTGSLEAPEGWKRFAAQDAPSVEGPFPVTAGTVSTLLSHTDLVVIRESQPEPSNFYLARDYLCVAKKKA
jgi:SAM-dependent methyltransferase